MPDWFKNLLETREDKQTRQFNDFAQTDEFKTMLREQASELIQEAKNNAEREKVQEEQDHQDRIDEAEKSISVMTEKMEASSEPYIMIRSLNFTPENGIEIKLDFNPAFIKYLNVNGIEGRNEDETIRRWLAYLSQEIVQEGIAEDYVLNGVPEDEVPSMKLEELLDEIQEVQDDEEELNTGW